ncbi:MAG: hypothetical protein HY537_18825 [Deltaproteobacteria bacterium]|nr:hypothetical protein [Deltaproteobacteria bacterium]
MHYFLLTVLAVWGSISLGGDNYFTQVELAKLSGKNFVDSREYIEPFVIVQTATTATSSLADQKVRLKQYFQESLLPVRAHFSQAGAQAKRPEAIHIELPIVLTTGKEVSGIRSCNSEKCLQKLRDDEKLIVQKAEDRVEAFRKIVVDRLQAYLLKKEYRGYEERKSNVEHIKTMIGLLPSLKESYPKCVKFFSGDFWGTTVRETAPLESFLRMEVIRIWPERLSPVMRITEVFEFEGPKGTLFFELPIYTNHYFDSSIRMVELIAGSASSKPSIVMTDIMEIDELKKSGLIRFLYTGQMQQAIALYQQDELAKIK